MAIKTLLSSNHQPAACEKKAGPPTNIVADAGSKDSY